jgi:metal-responsive CopG/Arc/MetJ family transcriptional regulator
MTAPVKFDIRLPADLAQRIEAWRHAHGALTRTEAIRRLLLLALDPKGDEK